MSTVSVENYIKAIFILSRDTSSGVSTSTIAEYLATKASSVTDMVQKLAGRNLVNYIKYQGVTLTPLGERIAVEIIRKHRLWELFLYKTLGFRWNEIHDIAEELEHVKSDILVERLDKFLDHPLSDPHGDPIPDKSGKFPENSSVLLSNMNKGITCTVVGVKDDSTSFLTYLDKLRIQLGSELRIVEMYEFDRSIDVKVNELELIHLSFKAAENILVE